MKKLLLCALAITLSTNAMHLSEELVQLAEFGLGSAAAAYVYSRGAERLSRGFDRDATHDLNYHTLTNGQPYRIHDGFSKWGALGSWWIGAPLAVAARLGSHGMEARELIKPVAIVYGATAALALLSGGYAYFTASPTKRKAKAVDATTLAARFAGTIAPVSLIGYILHKRVTA
ncbi:hypothetical protein BH09DEP1_BH09DEP1_4820 [soil metagenome]